MENYVDIFFPNGFKLSVPPNLGSELLEQINLLGLHEDFYVLYNGRKIVHGDFIPTGSVHVVPRLPGGKGGFGSMLRAIGAQIEKTTNREACRDLSGRRLRDINEEKRLKTWISQQADRERDSAERKRQRLERLMAQPKVDFKDPEYEAARSEMTEKVSDAVEQGFKAAASGSGIKRMAPGSGSSAPAKKKRTTLWLGADEEELSSSLDTSDESDDEGASCSAGPSNKSSSLSSSAEEDQQTVDKARPAETSVSTDETAESSVTSTDEAVASAAVK